MADLASIRHAAGVSQGDVAVLLDKPKNVVSNWETGRTQPPWYIRTVWPQLCAEAARRRNPKLAEADRADDRRYTPDLPVERVVYTQPRVITVCSVREGDEIATWTVDGHLIPTLAAIAVAESGKGVTWLTVGGTFGFESYHSIVCEEGRSWPKIGSYGNVIIRERVPPPHLTETVHLPADVLLEIANGPAS